MSLLEKLPQIAAESKAAYEEIKKDGFRVDAVIGSESENILAVGDNMAFMKYLAEDMNMAGKIQMVYIDPPFFSKTNYGAEIKLGTEKVKNVPAMKQFAYHDSWQEGMDEYLKMLCTRFYMIKDMLADDGCIWVHLDWHVVHYVKILLDEIFGEKNFVNEVIWNYKSGGSSKKHYARKHDTLLFYAKSKNYYFEPQKEKSYNRGYKPYRFKGVKEYRDETGWYTMVNMKDVWQLDMVGRTSSERTGYVTQKPETLLMRILESCTREGDIAADFFGGSGTLAAAAQKMGRKWIYCDLGSLAAVNAKKRLANDGADFKVLVQDSNPEKPCELTVEAVCENAGATDQTVLTVKLTDYDVTAESSIPVDEKHLDIIHKVVDEEPLKFIDFWSIDYNYDGITHKADAVFCRNKNGVQTEVSKLGNNFTTISVKAQDIFGNTVEKIIEVRR